MAYKLIGEDVGVTITIGDAAVPGGGAFVGGAGISTSGIVKRIGYKSSVQKTNVKSMGDVNVRNRYHSGAQTLELEGFVASTGLSFGATSGSAFDGISAVGYFATVSVKSLESLSAGNIGGAGVITDWSWDGALGSEQSEKITIDLNPDGVA